MKREELIVNCIEEIRGGKRTLQECLDEHPGIGSELTKLFNVAREISRETITPSAEFKQRAKNRLLTVMNATEAERRQARKGFGLFLVGRLSYAVTILCLVVVLGSGGTVYASRGSLPGETLYPVKTGVEQLQLTLSPSPESKANLHLKLTQRRVQEVVTESESGKVVSPSAFDAITKQIDNTVTDMNKVRSEEAKPLLSQLAELTSSQQSTLEQVAKTAPEASQPAVKKAIDTNRRGNLIAQVAGDNPSLLKSGASVLDDRLESGYFELEGTLLAVDGRSWNIGGIKLTNVNIPDGTPDVGSTIKLKGMIAKNETFTGRIEVKENTAGETSLKGIFNGTGADATTWSVGGISVGGFQNDAPPQEGSRLEIKGTSQDGVFIPRHDRESVDADEKKRDNSEDDNKSSGDNRDSSGDDNKSSGDSRDKSGDNNNNSGDNRDRSGDDNKSSGDSRDRSGDNRN